MTANSFVELLAPAGSPESFVAALESGANAVYLGLKQFNARGNAVNFSIEELGSFVPLAHEQGMRIYVTLNTVVKMNEMAPLLRSLRYASDCGIDGVILQDLGLARVISHHFPHLRKHASTQLAVHNLEGVAFCVREGFKRVVLARELTLAEIAEIREHFPPEVIELEVFCHGAMCYTYSGMCFFSGSVGGRSGNRGECAYTCRKGYKILNETSFPMAAEKDSYANYLFSMKDMNTLDILPELVEAGVDSLKIEGRRKGPAYVGASVKAYRSRLNAMATDHLERDLKLSFGRSYTRAFYERGQFGDAPIDLTATGTQGLEIGELDGKGRFQLGHAGIQRHDGIRLVWPDRTEERLSFTDYRVSHGDRMRPEKGSYISLKTNAPLGSKVYWVRSQSVAQRYKPKADLMNPKQNGIPLPVSMTVTSAGNALKVTVEAVGLSHSETIAVVPSESGRGTDIKKLLFRFGDSFLSPGDYVGPAVIDGFIPHGQLKKMRRRLLQPLMDGAEANREQEIQQLEHQICPTPTTDLASVQESNFILRTDKPKDLERVLALAAQYGASVDFLMRPTISTPDWKRVVETLSQFEGQVRLVLPLVLRKWDLRLLRRRIEPLVDKPFEWVVTNPGHFELLNVVATGVKLHADFSVYHLNSWALAALADQGVQGRFTLSLEDDRPNMEALLATHDPGRFEVIAYTDTPLFIAEACSLAALYGGCPGTKKCGHEVLHIENEHGDRFQVRHDRCRSTVIGDNALSWSGHLDWFKARGVRHFRIDFTVRDYSFEEMEARLKAVVGDHLLPATHTENLHRILL